MSDEKPTKFCKDCRFCVPHVDSADFLLLLIPIIGWVFLFLVWKNRYIGARCSFGEHASDVSLVSGKVIAPHSTFLTYCSTRRMSGTSCGEEGRDWETKASVIRAFSNKSLMGEIMRRGLANVMKSYKQDTE